MYQSSMQSQYFSSSESNAPPATAPTTNAVRSTRTIRTPAPFAIPVNNRQVLSSSILRRPVLPSHWSHVSYQRDDEVSDRIRALVQVPPRYPVGLPPVLMRVVGVDQPRVVRVGRPGQGPCPP